MGKRINEKSKQLGSQGFNFFPAVRLWVALFSFTVCSLHCLSCEGSSLPLVVPKVHGRSTSVGCVVLITVPAQLLAAQTCRKCLFSG